MFFEINLFIFFFFEGRKKEIYAWSPIVCVIFNYAN